ncbi:hypothetical protein AAMO2058_000272900 [Amorphochlora amoebiformis]
MGDADEAPLRKQRTKEKLQSNLRKLVNSIQNPVRKAKPEKEASPEKRPSDRKERGRSDSRRGDREIYRAREREEREGDRRGRRRPRSRSRSRDRNYRRDRRRDSRRRRRRRSSSSDTSEKSSQSAKEGKKRRKSNFGPAPSALAASTAAANLAAAMGVPALLGTVIPGISTVPGVPGVVPGTPGVPMVIPGMVQGMLMGAAPLRMGVVNPEVTRQARRLYVGNLPVGLGLTDAALMEFFKATVPQLGLKTPNPILSVWMSQGGTFCFVEFRAVEDTDKCMTLMQGLTLGGRLLRIGRPADYKAPPPHLANYIVPMNPGIPGTMGEKSQASAIAKDQSPKNPVVPSPVLMMLNMVTAGELVEDEEFNDIRNQVGIECEKFGRVFSVVIPRPASVEDDQDEGVDDDQDLVDHKSKGVGRIFVEYATSEEAKEARSKLHGRNFGGNKVVVKFYPVDKFKQKELGDEV